jgi:hypoxanthine phosphoribosyltransferase
MEHALRLRWDRATIAARVAELGARITAAYAGRDLLMVTVLKGGAVFLADLVRAVDADVDVDFLAVRLLHSGTSGSVGISKDLEVDIAGRDVLLVEDVIRSGLTMSHLVRTLAARDPASVRVCTLLDGVDRRRVSLPVDHVGFEVGSELLVGYGLDLDGWFRNCPDLWEVVDERAVRASPLAALARIRSIEGASPRT